MGFFKFFFIFRSNIHHWLHIHLIESGEHRRRLGRSKQAFSHFCPQPAHGHALFNPAFRAD